MLADRPVHTTLPAKDPERAKQFYRDTLGLSVESEAPGGIFFQSGNTHFLVFPTTGTASGTHTQMGWVVDDIEAEVADLKARGVVFEQYDVPGFDTTTGIATTGPVKAAWFKDSEGNLLGLVQL
jgi:catechol 2,3-dioxygenase-like lactoylglutathione lyase family enzyme